MCKPGAQGVAVMTFEQKNDNVNMTLTDKVDDTTTVYVRDDDLKWRRIQKPNDPRGFSRRLSPHAREPAEKIPRDPLSRDSIPSAPARCRFSLSIMTIRTIFSCPAASLRQSPNDRALVVFHFNSDVLGRASSQPLAPPRIPLSERQP